MTTKRMEINRLKRKLRVRSKVSGVLTRPRLSIFRSARHIAVQAVADDVGRTLAAASTLNEEVKGKLKGLKKTDAAREVGKLIAKRLKGIGVEQAVFDRGRFLYHGRVKALADGAREEGLKL